MHVARLLSLLAVTAVARVATAQPVLMPDNGPPGATYAPAPQPAPVPAPAESGTESWFTVGGLVDSSANLVGLRIQQDLFGTHAWSLGVAGTLTYRASEPAAAGVLYVARTGTLVGPLRLRAQLGFGAQAVASDSSFDSVTTSTLIEGALLLSANVGPRWAIIGGPIVQYAANPSPGDDNTSLTVMVGVQHR